MSDRISNKVYKTTSYDKFQAFKGNRGIAPIHVRNLAKSMKDHGWLDSMPMTCIKNGNGKLHILDGHNRFYAAKSIGGEVKYTLVDEKLGETEIYALNRTQKRWTSADFVKSYARMGNKEYERLQDFMERHKCGVATAAPLLTGTPAISTGIIESGNFKVNDEQRAEKLMVLLGQLRTALKMTIKINFLRVFLKATSFDDIDPSRLVDQMIKYPNLVLDFHREDDIATMLENVYNYHKGEKNKVPLAFMVKHRWKS